MAITSALYSGGPVFKSRSDDRLSCLTYVNVLIRSDTENARVRQSCACFLFLTVALGEVNDQLRFTNSERPTDILG